MISLKFLLRICLLAVVSFLLALMSGRTSDLPEGPYLDALLNLKKPVPVAHELLLVEGERSPTPDDPEPRPQEALVWSVAELGAQRALIPPSWLREGKDSAVAQGADLARVTTRVEEEFALIDENIEELFEAIRIGAVSPGDAERFVGQLLQLVERSKGRIQETLRATGDPSEPSLSTMVEAFGSKRLSAELTDLGLSLPHNPTAATLPVPPSGEEGAAFRRISYSQILRYLSLSRQIEARLLLLEEAGYLDEIPPQSRPSIMRDHLLSLRQEFYDDPAEERFAVWREARSDYFETVGRVIARDSESKLLDQLDVLESSGDLEEESAAQIRRLKQELSDTFGTLRDQYDELMAVRSRLRREIAGSLVIFEDGGSAEQRAIIANSVLLEEYVSAPLGWSRISLLAVAGFLVAVLLVPFRAVTAIALSPAAVLPAAALFPALFLFADIWIDPRSVATVLFGAAIGSIAVTFLYHWLAERGATGSAANRLPRQRLRIASLRGGVPRDSRGRRRAAIIVVAPLAGAEGNEPQELEEFHRLISQEILRLGGTVLGEEGENVIAAFEEAAEGPSGGEVAPGAGDERLSRTACTAAEELVSAASMAGIPIRCGMDLGDLLFYVSPIDGYRATGHPVTYARRLCGLAHKHRHHLLVGENVAVAYGGGAVNDRFEERGRLRLPDGEERYGFYALTERDRPSV